MSREETRAQGDFNVGKCKSQIIFNKWSFFCFQSMRGLCKEEDYAFLGKPERKPEETAEGAKALEDDWREKREERVCDEKEPKPTIITLQLTSKHT